MKFKHFQVIFYKSFSGFQLLKDIFKTSIWLGNEWILGKANSFHSKCFEILTTDLKRIKLSKLQK